MYGLAGKPNMPHVLRMLHGVLTQLGCAMWCACRYGNLVLAVEVISSTATFGYAVLLIKQSRPRPSLGLPLADPDEPLHPDDVMFNLRVLVPCYKEKVGLTGSRRVFKLRSGLLPPGRAVSHPSLVSLKQRFRRHLPKTPNNSFEQAVALPCVTALHSGRYPADRAVAYKK